MEPPSVTFSPDLNPVYDAEGVPAEHSLPPVESVQTEAVLSSGGGGDMKSRRRLYMVVISVFSIAAIIGISVMLAAGGDSEHSLNKNALTSGKDTVSDVRFNKVAEFLTYYTGKDVLVDPDSPQHAAALWIADEDPAAMDIPSSNKYTDSYPFVQRYILATFYFALAGPNWDSKMGFLGESSVCDWNVPLEVNVDDLPERSDGMAWVMGVQCNEFGEVDYIFIPDNGLIGELPPELGLLLDLEHLSLFSNTIIGEIPDALQYLEDLSFLSVENNAMFGPIPEWFTTSLKNLEYLDLGGNAFSGVLPSFSPMKRLKDAAFDNNSFSGSLEVFNNATALENLFLNDNLFEEALPDDLFYDLTNLKTLDLSDNEIRGSFPQHFYRLETLDLHNNTMSGPMPTVDHVYPMKFLSVYRNSFNGQLPNLIGALLSLEHLDLSLNAFSGTLPDSLNNLGELRNLYLAYNNFDEGPIPELMDVQFLHELSLKGTNRIGPIGSWMGHSLKHLRLLDLHGNRLTGQIPASLGLLEKLNFLMLNDNLLSGWVPDSFGDLQRLAMLTLDKNDLSGMTPEICATTGPPLLDYLTADCTYELDCKCCSECCEDGDQSCNQAELLANLDDTYKRDQFVFLEDNLIFSFKEDGTPL